MVHHIFTGYFYASPSALFFFSVLFLKETSEVSYDTPCDLLQLLEFSINSSLFPIFLLFSGADRRDDGNSYSRGSLNLTVNHQVP